ncbi:MAG: 7-cyano-7-deazaguanine synthase QueC [Deltaproteobacteria bacterium]|jgi:7-cyano-7-deazaguanine synthase|nr:7-cyano-7-deazaguanine synthase QueC [Deltaproteobacteria bacterium]
MSQKAIILLSSGLDSTVATLIAAHSYDLTLALTFDYGQRAAQREMETSSALCKLLQINHKIVRLPWLNEETKTALVDRSYDVPEPELKNLDSAEFDTASQVWVPNRNGLFISIAASYAEARDASFIIAGFNAEEGETFPDNSREFVDASNEALKYSTMKDVQVISPTIDLTKKEISEEFLKYDIPLDLFWCCYHGEKKLCGKCESCLRTIRAFKDSKNWNDLKGRFKTI